MGRTGSRRTDVAAATLTLAAVRARRGAGLLGAEVLVAALDPGLAVAGRLVSALVGTLMARSLAATRLSVTRSARARTAAVVALVVAATAAFEATA